MLKQRRILGPVRRKVPPPLGKTLPHGNYMETGNSCGMVRGQAEAVTVGHGHLSQCHNVPAALWSLVMGEKAGE